MGDFTFRLYLLKKNKYLCCINTVFITSNLHLSLLNWSWEKLVSKSQKGDQRSRHNCILLSRPLPAWRVFEGSHTPSYTALYPGPPGVYIMTNWSRIHLRLSPGRHHLPSPISSPQPLQLVKWPGCERGCSNTHTHTHTKSLFEVETIKKTVW